MKDLKNGKVMVVNEDIKVYVSTGSWSGYMPMPKGTVIVVLKKNKSSYTIASREDLPIYDWDSNVDFIFPILKLSNLKFDDVSKLIDCPKAYDDIMKIREFYK
jgi:hypothetical protein